MATKSHTMTFFSSANQGLPWARPPKAKPLDE
jgi:hypothetical protein